MKAISRFMALLIILGLTLLPSLSSSVQAVSEGGFCRSLEARQKVISKNLNSGMKSFEDSKSKVQEAVSKRFQRSIDDISDAREKADKLRAQSYRLISDKQDTEELTALAVQFADEVDEAIKIRREAYDSAREKYRDMVKSALPYRGEDLRQGVEGFVNRSEGALSEALASCEAGTSDDAAIRKNLVEQLRTERVSFGDLLRNRKDYRGAVNDAIEVKEKAYEDATRTFEQTMQEIRTRYSELKS